MKLSNFSDVGQIRSRNGTSMKRMTNADALESWSADVGGVCLKTWSLGSRRLDCRAVKSGTYKQIAEKMMRRG